MGISFPNLPANWKTPLFWLEFAPSGLGGAQNQQTLLVGPTITAQPATPVYVPSIADGIALFGANSVLAAMVQRYLEADPAAALYCLPIADAGGGVAAGGTVAFTGTATSAGVISLYIGGRLVSVPVAVGMTAAQAATAVVAAVNAYVDADGIQMPVTAAIDGTHSYQVDLTADNKGTQGNSLDVRLNYQGAQAGEAIPAGFTVAIGAMSAGATDPSMPSFDTILAQSNFDFIASAWNTATVLDAFKALMSNSSGRWSYLEQQYGHVWAAKQDADATGATNLSFGQSRNDAHATVFSYEPAPTSQWEVAAAAMGGCAASLRADPARPLQTLTVPGILPPPAGSRYTLATRNQLLNNGMALFDYAPDGTVQISRAVTTYQKNQWGTTDISYLDTETLYTLMTVVRTLKSDLVNQFPRAKLVADGTSFGPGTSFKAGLPDQPVVTPSAIRAANIASYKRMEAAGLVQDSDDFASGLIVQINANDPSRVDELFDPVLASGLRVLGVLTQFSLEAAS